MLPFAYSIFCQHPPVAEFGLERESLRVTAGGRLAQTPHPFGAHKNIDRDFCENQIEIIGDVFTDPDALIAQQNALLDEVSAALRQNGELLWPFSNPPRFAGEGDIPVAQFGGSLRSKQQYREYLAQKYGKRKMLFSGIHMNFSFSENTLLYLFEQSGEDNFRRFKDALYLRLAKRLTEYAPLLVFLTAASPVTDSSLGVPSNRFASVRCSVQGYWNDFVPLLDYADLEAYVQSIERYIASGALRSVSELYYPVRIKPRGANSLDSLREQGVNHLELRVFDVNPLTRAGVFREDIRFVELLMLYFLGLPDVDFPDEAQRRAIEGVKAAAVYPNEAIKSQAAQVLSRLQAFADTHFPSLSDAVAYQQSKLKAGGSYAETVSRLYSGDYLACGLALARQYFGVGCDV